MSLVFAGITPHSPLLVPTIAKEKIEKVEKTIEAMKKMEADLYISKPEILIIISPHASFFETSFSINTHEKFVSFFDPMGDMTTKEHWQGSPYLATILSREANNNSIPTRLVNEENLDYGAAVPLLFLTEHMKNIKILPVGYSGLSEKKHLEFGYIIKEVATQNEKRIAVIASGDMSHSSENPEQAKKFDEHLIKLLETRNTVGISNIDRELREGAVECCYNSILVLLGALKNMNYEFKNYSYESPFGVGYLVGNFVF